MVAQLVVLQRPRRAAVSLSSPVSSWSSAALAVLVLAGAVAAAAATVPLDDRELKPPGPRVLGLGSGLFTVILFGIFSILICVAARMARKESLQWCVREAIVCVPLVRVARGVCTSVPVYSVASKD